MGKTILLTNHYDSAPYSIVLSELPEGFTLEMLPENSQEKLEEFAVKADYILASGRIRITKEVLNKTCNLKMIQRTGVGLDSLDLAAINEKCIPLYVNQGVNSESVAEHTLLLMLACLRKLTVVHKNTVNGVWKKQEQGVQTRELAGKTVGLVGMGNIARVLVRLLKGFGVNILYYAPHRLSEETETALGIKYCDFEQMLSEADILSLHCPLTENTRHMLNAETIEYMKSGSILINTARGGLIDTNALTTALQSGKIAFAGLDVHEEEPLKAGNSIMQLDNVILTPHIGGITYDSFRQMMHDAMRNIDKFDKGDLDAIAQYRYI